MDYSLKVDLQHKLPEILTPLPEADPEAETAIDQPYQKQYPSNGEYVLRTQNLHYWQSLAERLNKFSAHQTVTSGRSTVQSEDTMLLRQLNTNELLNTMAGMNQLELAEEETVILKKMYDEMDSLISKSTQAKNLALDTSSIDGLLSDKDIGELITALMGKANDDYLKIYEHAVSQQSQFWKRVSELQAKLKNLVKADGENIKFDVNSYRQILTSLYVYSRSSFIYPPTDVNGNLLFLPTKEQALNWEREFYGDAGKKIEEHVTATGEHYWTVHLASEAIENLLINLPPSTMTSTEYQAWYTGFTSQIEDIKTFSQTLTTKYSSANSTFDSLIKLLTSTITTLFDNCKEFMRW